MSSAIIRWDIPDDIIEAAVTSQLELGTAAIVLGCAHDDIELKTIVLLEVDDGDLNRLGIDGFAESVEFTQ